MISSPFPHVRARAAADMKKNQNTKKTDAWGLFWSTCCRAVILIILTLAATIAYHMATASEGEKRPMGRALESLMNLHEKAGDSAATIVRHEDANATTASDRFFIDISMSAESIKDSKMARFMEKKGWPGVCVAPIASHSDVAGRSCKLVALPVGPFDGQPIAVNDCSRNIFGLQTLLNRFFSQDECPQVHATTVSITKVLHIASAPKVIDYIAIDTHGSELGVLNTFPFNEHCVRAWLLKGREAVAVHGIKHTLEVTQGCRTRVSADEVFARCPCDQSKRDRKQVAPAPTETSVLPVALEILPSGTQSKHQEKLQDKGSGASEKHQEKHRKGAKSAHDSAALSTDGGTIPK